MNRILIFICIGLIIFQKSVAQTSISGPASNGLQPIIELNGGGGDWFIEIDLLAKQNFSRSTWLRITNRVGAKIRGWNTNGVEMPMIDRSALAALTLPTENTVSNVMHGVERSRQGLQWWRTNLKGVTSGKRYPTTTFHLAKLFGVPLTNDIILSLAPLIYKVDSQTEIAHLIEFPAVRLHLKTDGTVEKLK
ncbi:MAG: hypothetical protein ACLQU4_08680 [Limisphaerales bacterium]